MNHNQILGVSPAATASEIQSAFRKAAMEVHPDHSNSPEAAEAFARIKEARDKLMKRASTAEAARDDHSLKQAYANSVKATTNATYARPVDDSLFDGMTPEEVAHVQMLDELVRAAHKRSLLSRVKESTDLRRHRRKIETNNDRLMGKY